MLKNKEIKPRNDLERAAFYFYLISTSFGSSMGQFAMSKQRAPKRLCRDFSLHTKRLKNVYKFTIFRICGFTFYNQIRIVFIILY